MCKNEVRHDNSRPIPERTKPNPQKPGQPDRPPDWPRRAKPKTRRPMKAIRAYCLDCSESPKAVAYCSCDGFHSTRCEFWPYRFGRRPETARVEFGNAMLTPELMPGPAVELESLPKNPRDYRPKIAEKAVEPNGRPRSQPPIEEVV